MTKYITEVLKEINDNPELVSKHKTNAGLRIVLEYSYDPAKKFLLPDGVPPYKKDSAPIGMSPGNIHQEFRRFYVFCRADLTPFKRETIFVQLLENVHPSEAELMLAIKDQELTRLYPNLDRAFAESLGFVKPLPVAEPTLSEAVEKDPKPKTKKTPAKKAQALGTQI